MCGALLAQAGQHVLILEAADTLVDKWGQPVSRPGCEVPIGVTVTREDHGLAVGVGAATLGRMREHATKTRTRLLLEVAEQAVDGDLLVAEGHDAGRTAAATARRIGGFRGRR